MEIDAKKLADALITMAESADVTVKTRLAIDEFAKTGDFGILRGNEELSRMYAPVFLPIYTFKNPGEFIPNVFLKGLE